MREIADQVRATREVRAFDGDGQAPKAVPAVEPAKSNWVDLDRFLSIPHAKARQRRRH
ncbi:MAG: hypothetical protein IJ092_15010 [Atopobiaceae bacterium]|nr:hypothetical protein [Atopobiaceae bacterium]